MRLSVIIPAWNEAENLVSTLAALPPGAEVVVADGGSSDGTVSIARKSGAKVVSCERRRAVQMNQGAEASSGDVLLFLHADGVLGPEASQAIEKALASTDVVGGSFRLRIRGGRRALALVAFGSNLRARYLGMPYGDQAFFLRRSSFEAVNGFSDVPFLEDVEIVNKVKRLGRLVQVQAEVTTGARHWEQLGPLGTTLLNWSMVALYFAGVAPQRLAPTYQKWRAGRRRSRPAESDQPVTL